MSEWVRRCVRGCMLDGGLEGVLIRYVSGVSIERVNKVHHQHV